MQRTLSPSRLRVDLRAYHFEGFFTTGRGFAQGCGKPNHGENEHVRDDNHDHEFNDEDRDWKSRHHHDE